MGSQCTGARGEDLQVRVPVGTVVEDADTGEVVSVRIPVLPSTYKCQQSGAALPVENPLVWVYQTEETS